MALLEPIHLSRTAACSNQRSRLCLLGAVLAGQHPVVAVIDRIGGLGQPAGAVVLLVLQRAAGRIHAPACAQLAQPGVRGDVGVFQEAVGAVEILLEAVVGITCRRAPAHAVVRQRHPKSALHDARRAVGQRRAAPTPLQRALGQREAVGAVVGVPKVLTTPHIVPQRIQVGGTH
jgi:hypothetical protein